MKYILTHIQDWLTIGANLPISTYEWYFLFLLFLLCAGLILNSVRQTSDLPEMAGNVLVLLAGAILGRLLFPDWSPPIEFTAHYSMVLLSGMIVAGALVVAMLRPS